MLLLRYNVVTTYNNNMMLHIKNFNIYFSSDDEDSLFIERRPNFLGNVNNLQIGDSDDEKEVLSNIRYLSKFPVLENLPEYVSIDHFIVTVRFMIVSENFTISLCSNLFCLFFLYFLGSEKTKCVPSLLMMP